MTVSCCDCRCCCYPGAVPCWPLQINRMVQCDPRSALHTPAVGSVPWRKQVALWKCPPKVWVYTTRNIQLAKDSDSQQSGGSLDILETLAVYSGGYYAVCQGMPSQYSYSQPHRNVCKMLEHTLSGNLTVRCIFSVPVCVPLYRSDYCFKFS